MSKRRSNKSVKRMIASTCKYPVEWDSVKSRHGEVIFGSVLYPLEVRYCRFKYGAPISLTASELKGE